MNFNRPLILASSSPRRQFLLKEAGFSFTVDSPNIDESFPATMDVYAVPVFLAEKKAQELVSKITDQLVIASDTVVILKGGILNKPADRTDAIKMLSSLSGQTHVVVTGVCILDKKKKVLFDDRTEVTFKELSKAEIEFYIDTCKPFDKAGAYGAQDWLGMVGVEKINGSYFTVMGLPIHKVYHQLITF
jgi:septum formation protein